MKVEVGLFIGLILSFWIFIVILFDFLTSRSTFTAKKELNVIKNTCEVCTSIYFVYFANKYWRCPLCGSININNKDDYRDRNSSR